MQKKSVEELWRSDRDQCRRALELYRDVLERQPRDSKTNRPLMRIRILLHIVNDALTSLSKVDSWRMLTSSAIQHALYEKRETTKKPKDASSWLAGYKDQFESEHERIRPILNEEAIEKGIAFRVDLEVTETNGGGESNEYGLCFMPVVNESGSSEFRKTTENVQPSPKPAIYQPDIAPRLSFRGELVFGEEGYVLKGARRNFILAVAIAPCVVISAAVATIVWSMLAYARPISTADLVLFAIIAVLAYAGVKYLSAFLNLGNNRISLAPDWALKDHDPGTTIEIIGDRSIGETPVIKIRRYTAECPICGGMLRVAEGEPDFEQRLVGRCTNSPREHVYSFDRQTKRGRPLITPYVKAQESHD